MWPNMRRRTELVSSAMCWLGVFGFIAAMIAE
jgi:hypothetical protein